MGNAQAQEAQIDVDPVGNGEYNTMHNSKEGGGEGRSGRRKHYFKFLRTWLFLFV